MVAVVLLVAPLLTLPGVEAEAATVEPTATRVEIAPSVWMPRLTLNAYPNTSSWLHVGGRGMDCALDYGDARQREMGRAVASSGLPRSELFITTKVPCCPKGPFGRSGWPFLPVPNCEHASRNSTDDILHDLRTIGVEYVDLLLAGRRELRHSLQNARAQ